MVFWLILVLRNMQIFERAGFSFYNDSPLDMRMSPAHQTITAADVINKSSEKKLCEIFWNWVKKRMHRKLLVQLLKNA